MLSLLIKKKKNTFILTMLWQLNSMEKIILDYKLCFAYN